MPTTKTHVVTSNVDDALVMKCLSDNVDLDSKYKIALFDFGGQSVFNVIHPFFLTQYGVYLVVFNMEWILGTEGRYISLHVVILYCNDGCDVVDDVYVYRRMQVLFVNIEVLGQQHCHPHHAWRWS